FCPLVDIYHGGSRDNSSSTRSWIRFPQGGRAVVAYRVVDRFFPSDGGRRRGASVSRAGPRRSHGTKAQCVSLVRVATGRGMGPRILRLERRASPKRNHTGAVRRRS